MHNRWCDVKQALGMRHNMFGTNDITCSGIYPKRLCSHWAHLVDLGQLLGWEFPPLGTFICFVGGLNLDSFGALP